MSGLSINTGTGPKVTVDPVGTDNYQVVKIVQGASGTASALGTVLAVTGVVTQGGTVTITGTVGSLMLQRLDNTNDSILIYGAQTGSGINQPLAVSTTGGLYIASGGGGGSQYGVGSTVGGATGTGTFVLALQSGSTAAQTLLVTTTGGLYVQTVATITTLLGTVAVSGGGGGAQYAVDSTAMAATATGTIVLGMQTGATTGRGIAVTTTGAQFVTFAGAQTVTAANVTIASMTTGTVNVVNVLSASGVTIASITTGTMNVINVLSASGVTIGNVTGSSIYTVAGTALGTTGQGVLVVAIQSGSTAAQPFAVTTTGAQYVTYVGTPAVTAANVTIASVTTGTMNVVNVLSASGVTIASVTTGTMNVVNVLTGNMVIVTTAKNLAGGITSTAHASQFQAFVLATTSAAAGVIVKTSGATTLYITDLLINVAGPMNVLVCSETTTMAGPIYLGSQGGFTMNLVQPLICTTAQSLRVILSSSGSCSVLAVGYTVV